VVLFNVASPSDAQSLPQADIAPQAFYTVYPFIGTPSDQQITVWDGVQTRQCLGRNDGGLGHRQRFENLVLHATGDVQRNNGNAGAGDVGSDVRHLANEVDTRQISKPLHSGSRPSTY